MTTALYRRYRPESFAEVIGQEQVTGPLSVALNKNRVNHAYLFSGPRGCGKTTSARILARCLNCEQGPTSTPCGTCPSCVDLARGGPGSLDVVEIDAASHGGVDDARDLRERAAFAPVRDRYKVFIIDEAHMVSPQGFNALLKIVEEPPEHIRFIFATTEPEKVIGTIRSRTHHYPFRLVPPERLTQYLAELCEREGVEAGKGVLPLVVRAGTGSVRDTLSVLDQLIGGSGEEGLTYATAIGLLGFTDSALLDDVADALAAGDGATVFRVIDRVIESGHDPRRFVEDLLERLRDLLVVAAVKDGGHAVFRGMPDDQLERMRSQAGRFGAAELSRAADVTNAALTDMTGATSPRLQLELLCARLLLPAADDEQRGLGARMDRLEKRVGSGALVAAPGIAVPEIPVAPVVDMPAAGPQARSSGLAAVRAAIGKNTGTGTASADTPDAAPVAAESGDAFPGGASESGTRVTPEPSAAPEAPVAEPPAPESRPTPPPTAPTAPTPQPEPARPAVQPPPAPTAPVEQPPVRPPGAQPPAGGGAGDLEAVRRNWTDVLNAVASIKRTTWSLVSQYAQVLDFDGRRLLLGFDSAGRAQSFGRGPHPNFMRQALIEVLGLDCVVEAAVTSEFQAGGGSLPAPQTPAPQNPGPQSSGPATSARSAPPEQTPPHSAPQPRPAPIPERPAPGSGPQAWAEVPQNAPATWPTPTAATSPGGGVGVATREAPPVTAVPAAPAPATPPAPPATTSERPRSVGAAAARAAAAAAAARTAQQNQNQNENTRPNENSQPQNTRPAPSGRRPATDDDRGMPTPQATPYDDIPPDLNEPVREDEAPPDGGGRPGRPSPRTQPAGRSAPASSPAPGPPVSVDVSSKKIDLADDTVSNDDADFDASPLVGVQAVEQLLGGRVIDEREI
ncbi:DNA polymerase III subunit gamma and tau [Kineosporia succinea]|uniref:DNA-directed DNA polymerase n=1 Tax=Kineosporia succinea TaxID=84632 RepID=A0ABT9P1J2_9ACTN|nr:DNA polymerase III subunit gamma and tau [Kineosporia succinea]MDP9826095.1 DNA polymerase-3 subunit gamma/tau [Kineosporia succinea]